MAPSKRTSAPQPVPGSDGGHVDRRCATGIAGLDHVLLGGFPAHRFYLIQGDPGVGKTTLALQFLMEGRRLGEQGLYITLSETKAELEGVARSHGWDLSGFATLDLSSIEAHLQDESQTTMFQPSEVELNQTTRIILDQVGRVRPVRVVFDSMSEMRLLAQSSLRFRRQMLALKQHFIGIDCTVLFLDDNSSGADDRNMQSLVHGVIALEQLSPEFGAERRRLNIIKIRGSSYRGGYHDYVIAKGGMRVFPRLVAAEHHRQFDDAPASSGIPALDELFGAGLDRGTSNLLIGPAGTGKSTVATAFAAAAAERGEHAVIYSFDETQAIWQKRSSALRLDVARHLAEGRIRSQQIDPAELSPGQFATMVQEDVEQRHARVVIIDSLNGYLNAMPEDRLLALQLHEMLSYLSQSGVVTIMTLAQHGLVGAMQTPVDVTYVADTVAVLRYFEAFGEVKKAISVVKKRSGGHERKIREYLVSTTAGIEVGEPLTEFHGVLTGTPTYHGAVSEMMPDRKTDDRPRKR